MRSANRIVGLAVGIAYLLLGGLGFLVPAEGGLLAGVLQVNALQNAVHLVLGAALLVPAMSNAPASRAVNAGVGGVFLVLGLAGLFLVGSPANVLALNITDNALHFGTAVVLLAVGLGADRSQPA